MNILRSEDISWYDKLITELYIRFCSKDRALTMSENTIVKESINIRKI